ncbi:hypothetical protein [Streptobacillus notomytis]|uniref:hypothetical protein n=1 Tax=Streptobacillus notomytis TaxID=1712031 RepID=UPI000ABB7350|nr:hypothetical protein [Streptobacillus notomytis]
MKKLLLSIILLAGLISFPAKLNRSKYGTRKYTTTSTNTKNVKNKSNNIFSGENNNEDNTNKVDIEKIEIKEQDRTSVLSNNEKIKEITSSVDIEKIEIKEQDRTSVLSNNEKIKEITSSVDIEKIEIKEQDTIYVSTNNEKVEEDIKKTDEILNKVKLTGPRYRLELALGAVSIDENVKKDEYFSTSIAFLPEWNAKINDKMDISFGPKLTLNVATKILKTNGSSQVSASSSSVKSSSNKDYTIIPNLILGGEGNFNYRIEEDIKVYTGLEVGLGIGPEIKPSNGSTEVGYSFVFIGKMSVGIKIKDKYNIGIYTGNVKGILGIEAGYTF